MKPIGFNEQTKVLSKPIGMSDEECGSLAIFNDGEICVSCWKGGWRERIKFLFTGMVWLQVWSGVTQPPVRCDIDKPFVKEK